MIILPAREINQHVSPGAPWQAFPCARDVRTSLRDALRAPVPTARRALGIRDGSADGSDALEGVVLEPRLDERLRRVATATFNTKRNRAPFRHLLLHGPPGTGKTLFAKVRRGPAAPSLTRPHASDGRAPEMRVAGSESRAVMTKVNCRPSLNSDESSLVIVMFEPTKLSPPLSGADRGGAGGRERMVWGGEGRECVNHPPRSSWERRGHDSDCAIARMLSRI